MFKLRNNTTLLLEYTYIFRFLKTPGRTHWTNDFLVEKGIYAIFLLYVYIIYVYVHIFQESWYIEMCDLDGGFCERVTGLHFTKKPKHLKVCMIFRFLLIPTLLFISTAHLL